MGTRILLGYYLTTSVSKDERERYSSVKEQKSGIGTVCLCIFSKLLSATLFYMQKLESMF